ncbi:MAG: hypothetical protein PHQ11_09385 [Paludibacter sp.]|nr:hypothetical protein [Paludibacter sp.]MDD4199239.1 hypothetical protein [Paludibacter sp.]
MNRQKLKTILLISFCIAGFSFSCKDPVTVDEGYEAPNPPAEVNQRNLITVEFYSRLNEETLFQNNESELVVNRISSITSPLAYLFDRSDAVMGQTSPVVEIGWQTQTKSFFVQNTLSDSYVQGTGMIVRPIVNVFEGASIPDTLFIGGCTLMAPLGNPVTVTLMTCKLDHKMQFPALVNILGDGLNTNKLVIGTVKQHISEDMKHFLKHHLKYFRLSFHETGLEGRTHQLFILTPINFIGREVLSATVGTLPMYQCKIEYLKTLIY